MENPVAGQKLTTNEAAFILGVSPATIRNWSKAGHLPPASSRPLCFFPEQIANLKERILTNRFNRLRKRANRTASDRQGIAGVDAAVNETVVWLRRLAGSGQSDPGRVVFSAALHQLRESGEAEGIGENFDAVRWRRGVVRDVMCDWLRRNDGAMAQLPVEAVESFLRWEKRDDPLGVLYQGLSSEGAAARSGAYFTPVPLIDDCLADLGARPERFLDPCCGTGRYLVRAARRFELPPDRIHGFDNDPVAVDIARINVLLHYPDLETMPDIRCLDSLNELATGQPDCDTNHFCETVDAVATNPPWGSCKNSKRNHKITALVRSGESFALFLEKSLALLKPGGRLNFLLPEAMLRIKAHTDIRKLILEQATIEKIALLGRVFHGVFTPIISLTLVKRPAEPDWQVTVTDAGATHRAAQARFADNTNHAFDVAVTPLDKELIDRMYAVPHLTLAGKADWALGIVTGDNARHLLDAPGPEAEGVLRGRDVFPFAPRAARTFIHFRPDEFQQVAPQRFYRAPEKLIYRFVSDRLIFAYDKQGTLTLNSANILIPRLPGFPIKVAMAFLNSRVFQFIFTKRFRTRKILRGDLEMLPFPILDEKECRRIGNQVEKCMGGEYLHAEKLDQMVYQAFGLTAGDILAIEDGLVKEGKSLIL